VLSAAGQELKEARAELVNSVTSLSEENARLKSDLALVGNLLPVTPRAANHTPFVFVCAAFANGAPGQRPEQKA